MPLSLRRGVSYCLCGDRAVFLDIEADRYFCLAPECDAAFQRLANGEGLSARSAEARALVTSGLVVDDSGGRGFPAPCRVGPARDDLVAGPASAAGASETAAALAAQLWAAANLRLRSFSQIVAIVERRSRRRRPPRADADSLLRQIGAAFAASTIVLPVADRCLVRSIAFHSACARRGINAQIVFGVRLNPFAAHCWVQLDDKVLVGEFEQVRLFTPILVV